MNTREFREKYFRIFKDSGSPIEGVFELTGRCNLNCKMCYVHTKTNAEFLETEKSGDWWIEQIDAACDRGMLFALLTGGECLLHPDFRRIYTYLRERGVRTRINTNGLLLTKNNIEFFKKNPPLEIQLTIYGSDDVAYKEITGAPVFSQVEEAINRVREAGLNVRVSVTPNSIMPGETERIIKYLKSIHALYTISQTVFTAYDEKTEQTISKNDADVDERICYLKQDLNKKHTPIAIECLPPIGGGCNNEVRGLHCSAGRVSFAISHDGCMMPCTAMYHLRVPIVDEVDFNVAWEKMLEISRNYLLPVECEGCAYKKACYSCVVARNGNVGNGHCDPAVCELTRKLVAAGVKKLDQVEQNHK